MTRTPLPPSNLRMAGVKYKDDKYFIASGVLDAHRFRSLCGMTETSRILDLGCGPGRVLVGLVESNLPFASYLGIDILPRQIAWAQKNLSKWGTFIKSNDKNERYNPKGKKVTSETRLPVDTSSIDIIMCSSVFTHMRLGDIRVYLKELSRVLAPGGSILATFFENPNQVKAEIENPPEFKVKKATALLRVCLSTKALHEAVSAAGLTVVDRWPDPKQPAQLELLLRKK